MLNILCQCYLLLISFPILQLNQSIKYALQHPTFDQLLNQTIQLLYISAYLLIGLFLVK